MLKEEKREQKKEGREESRKRDVWVLSFGVTVINGCPFAGLCTPTVRLEPWVTRGSLRGKERQTDEERQAPCNIYSLSGSTSFENRSRGRDVVDGVNSIFIPYPPTNAQSWAANQTTVFI